MTFKEKTLSDLEDTHLKMLDASTPTPYRITPKIDNYQFYSNNRNKYHERLDTERAEFYCACSTIDERRNARINVENDAKENKAKKRFKRRQRHKTIIFFFPILIAILAGIDVLTVSHGNIAKAEAIGMSLGWVIALFVIYCLLMLTIAIILTVKMYSNELFVDKNKIYDTKPYTVCAVILFVISFFIISLNLSQIVPNLGKNKLTYLGGDTKTYEYINKGDSIKLPDECLKSDISFEDYKSKYVLIGWVINDETYAPGITYVPKGWEYAEALYREDKYCHITVSTIGYASVTVKYSDGKEWKGEDVLYGTSMIVTCSNAGQEQTQQINGVDFSSPHNFVITKHTSIYCLGQDKGCLVEGTQIALADGTTKTVENLQMGDVLTVFNHETGKYDSVPLLCNIHANMEADYYNIINLHFSDGTLLRIVDEHGLFDKDLNKYVYINEENAQRFIGHNFVSIAYYNGEILSETVTLERIEITNEYTKIFNPASVWHINLIANNILTLSAGMVNLFKYDENMKYDETLMRQDIEKYGLYTYDDFKNYITVEVFNVFPFAYYKIPVEKGEFSFDMLLGLIDFYKSVYSIQ